MPCATTTRDRELLNRLRDLNRDLNTGATVRLAHERNPDQYAESLRDLGYHLRDLGDAMLARVAELEHDPSTI